MKWICLLGLALLGCSEPVGDGRVVGSIRVPDCSDDGALRVECGPEVPSGQCDAFSLGVDFFAAESNGRGALLRLQRGGRNLSLTDALIFEIRDARKLRGKLGEVQAVGPDQNIRAALGLFDRCPDSTQSFVLTGVVKFDVFGLELGDRIAGSIERLELRDGRPEFGIGEVLGVLHGEFDFVVEKGPPYQQFTGN